MTYRGYDILTAVVWMVLGAALMVLGFFLRRPDFGEAIWWVVTGVGVALIVVGVVSVFFTMRQAVEMNCPHCGGRIMPRVKPDTSHLYLAKAEEDEKGVETPADEAGKLPED
ncbi:MAG: hypothetical protein IBX67_07440 [Dehalococcoidia bacterium]|nr:hypothetical protein [Dehalococcoidia bacterium]